MYFLLASPPLSLCPPQKWGGRAKNWGGRKKNFLQAPLAKYFRPPHFFEQICVHGCWGWKLKVIPAPNTELTNRNNEFYK